MNQKLDRYKPLHHRDNTQKFLREFFNHLSSGGQSNLAEDVSGCINDAQLRQLVQSIRTGLLTPLKAQGGQTPATITQSPREGVESISRSPQQQLRRNCMERDGNMCVATHIWSRSHQYPKGAPRGAIALRLEAAHIIPYTLGAFWPTDRTAVDKHAKIWVQLGRYFPKLHRLTSEQLNSETNVMMLTADAHYEFGQFNITFEETRVRNQYHIKTFPKTPTWVTRDLPPNRMRTFRVHKGRWLLPDPELLRIHAAIGNFLHATGEGERIDKLLEDLGDRGVLAPDGSTNIEEFLSMKLSLSHKC